MSHRPDGLLRERLANGRNRCAPAPRENALPATSAARHGLPQHRRAHADAERCIARYRRGPAKRRLKSMLTFAGCAASPLSPSFGFEFVQGAQRVLVWAMDEPRHAALGTPVRAARRAASPCQPRSGGSRTEVCLVVSSAVDGNPPAANSAPQQRAVLRRRNHHFSVFGTSRHAHPIKRSRAANRQVRFSINRGGRNPWPAERGVTSPNGFHSGGSPSTRDPKR